MIYTPKPNMTTTQSGYYNVNKDQRKYFRDKKRKSKPKITSFLIATSEGQKIHI